MYCARCWVPVGAHDRACTNCQADLTLPGSVRLTDPNRLKPARAAPSTSSSPAAAVASLPQEPQLAAPSAASETPTSTVSQQGPATAPEPGREPAAGRPPAGATAAAPATADSPDAVAAPVDADPPITDGAVGWWSSTKGKLVELGEKAAEANRSRTSSPQPDPAAATSIDRDEPPTAPSGSAADSALQTPESERPRPPAAERTPQSGTGTPRPVRRREPGELNLWDDYGMADSREWYEANEEAPPGQRVGQLLGASVMPTAKTFTFLLVLGAALVLLMLLVSLLLNLDALFFARRGSAPPAPAPTTAVVPSAEPTPTAQPTPTPEPEPTPEPTNHTPSMLPGAKECAPGVWAGPQTSCPLAEAVAEQVDLEMSDQAVVDAFSPVTNQAYRLECVADEGISCTGLDGVVGVYVWLVTAS